MGTVTLITGGVRSGKSAWALQRANAATAGPRVFIATATPCDSEMADRIAAHRAQRGEGWQTVEEPLDLAAALGANLHAAAVVVDCCTVWLGNVWHAGDGDGALLERAVASLCAALDVWRIDGRGELYVVTNEVGWGIVPLDEKVRLYRDCIGTANQRMAACADRVVLVVAGIAVTIK